MSNLVYMDDLPHRPGSVCDTDLKPGWEKHYDAGVDKCFYVNKRTAVVTDSPSVVSSKPVLFANPSNQTPDEENVTPPKAKKASLLNIFGNANKNYG
eukprot:CFRG5206T1